MAQQRPRSGAAAVLSPLRTDEVSMAVQLTSVWQRRSSRQLINGILKQVMRGSSSITQHEINPSSPLPWPLPSLLISIAAYAASAATAPFAKHVL